MWCVTGQNSRRKSLFSRLVERDYFGGIMSYSMRPIGSSSAS